jgi:transposase
MARLMKIGRMHLDGKTPAEIAEHFGFSRSYAYSLLKHFDRVTTPRYINHRNVNPFSNYMKKEECKELMHIKDWLEFLSKETE